MSDRESSAVGFRIRGMAPPDLSTYPDSVKLMFWQWVTDSALVVKDRELSKGWDKDGQIHPLHRETIKHRKSEVGPVTKTAPRLEPALKLSRVRSLLRGRAHHSSAELYWDFDAVTGDSFAVILHYQAEEYGHDVFGLSDRGTAQVRREALDKWQAWKVEAGHARPRVGLPGVQEIEKRKVKKPIAKREVKGRMDLENFTLSSNGEKLRAAIEAGEFTGFKRLNARGEQWKPGTGIPPAPGERGPGAVPRPVKPAPKPAPMATKVVVEKQLGVRFVPHSAAQDNRGYVTVIVSVAKVDADLRKSKSQYVGPGGTGAAIAGRYENFARFLERARNAGTAIEQPRAYIAVDTGLIDLGDGRHRFAVLRDQGAVAVPVSVRRSEAAEIRRRYGYAQVQP